MPNTSEYRPNERIAVSNLQRYLRQLSYDEPTIIAPPQDGIFSDATENALRAFQTSRAMEPTGKADYDTWNRLYEDYIESVLTHSSPATLNPFPRFPVNYTVGPGSRGFLVEIIQYILNELSATYTEIPETPQNGVYHSETEAGVRVFQRIHGLPETGTVDRKTWNALVHAFNLWNAKNQ